MGAELLGWFAFAAAVIGAGLLFQRMRSAEASARAARVELEASAAELAAVHKRVEQGRADLRARGEELAELRKKYEKIKKRAGESLEEEKTLPARIRLLEADLASEKADARAARDEIVRLHAEIETAGVELARERARASTLVPPSSTDEVDGLRGRVAELEAKTGRLAADLEAARHDTSKYKGRWETLEKAYVILRGELELKKDETRNQRVELERLRTLEVILTAPEPDSRT